MSEKKNSQEMSEAAREAMLKYRRAWYKKNKDKQREYTARYWEKKAAAAADQEEQQGE